MSRKLLFAGFSLLTIGAFDAGAVPSTVVLATGGAVRGEVLSESAERIVVDLWFTILQVPRDSVARILKDSGGPPVADAAAAADFYRMDPLARTQRVKDLVNHIGERVVLVKTPPGLIVVEVLRRRKP